MMMLKKREQLQKKEIFMHIITPLLVMIGLTFNHFWTAIVTQTIEKIEHVYG